MFSYSSDIYTICKSFSKNKVKFQVDQEIVCSRQRVESWQPHPCVTNGSNFPLVLLQPGEYIKKACISLARQKLVAVNAHKIPKIFLSTANVQEAQFNLAYV